VISRDQPRCQSRAQILQLVMSELLGSFWSSLEKLIHRQGWKILHRHNFRCAW
jgi:hypothetical protein